MPSPLLTPRRPALHGKCARANFGERHQAERTIAWLFGCRRLRIRYDRGSERFYAFGLLACCRLSFNRYTNQMTRRPDRPLLAW